MSKIEKLIAKLCNKKGAFTWSELVTLLAKLGYQTIEGNGSRVKFDNGNPEQMRPHPGSEVPAYARRQIIDKLKSGGLIQ